MTSVNVACGWHAGDRATMTPSIALAARHGLALGAHPGVPDLAGFGRRAMGFSPTEAAQAVLYQYGALRALADAQGVPVVHVKPRGSLYGLVSRDVAEAFAELEHPDDGHIVIDPENRPRDPRWCRGQRPRRDRPRARA